MVIDLSKSSSNDEDDDDDDINRTGRKVRVVNKFTPQTRLNLATGNTVRFRPLGTASEVKNYFEGKRIDIDITTDADLLGRFVAVQHVQTGHPPEFDSPNDANEWFASIFESAVTGATGSVVRRKKKVAFEVDVPVVLVECVIEMPKIAGAEPILRWYWWELVVLPDSSSS